jgi:hypothetical protein
MYTMLQHIVCITSHIGVLDYKVLLLQHVK